MEKIEVPKEDTWSSAKEAPTEVCEEKSSLTCIMSLFIGLSFLVSEIVIIRLSKQLSVILSQSVVNVVLLSLSILSFCFIVEFLYFLLVFSLKLYFKKNLFTAVIIKEEKLFHLSFTMLISSIAKKYFRNMVGLLSDTEGIVTYDGNITKYLSKYFFDLTLDTILLAFSLMAFMLAVKNSLIITISSYLRYETFEERLAINSTQMAVLRQLCRNKECAKREGIGTFEELYVILSGDMPLTTDRLKKNVLTNQEDIDLLFKTQVITKNNFCKTFAYVLREYLTISKSLTQKDACLAKLDTIFSSFAYPLGILAMACVVGGAKYLTSFIVGSGGCLLSFAFMFDGLIQDLSKSIMFIVFVRPFEVGDLLQIKDRIYEVKEIGLLYSTFVVESLICHVSNLSLASEKIVNYRKCDSYKKTYSFLCDHKEYMNNYEALKACIDATIKKGFGIVKPQCEIIEKGLSDRNMVVVHCELVFLLRYQGIEELQNIIDCFLLSLRDSFVQNGIKISQLN